MIYTKYACMPREKEKEKLLLKILYMSVLSALEINEYGIVLPEAVSIMNKILK